MSVTRAMERELLQNVTYSNSRRRRDKEEVSSKLFRGKPDEKLQSKAEIDENLKSRPARWEMNGEEAESNERRFRSPWKGGSVLDICGGGLSLRKSGVWMRRSSRFGNN